MTWTVVALALAVSCGRTEPVRLVSQPGCGNGVVEAGEACDDGNDDTSDGCVWCAVARCGDGVVWRERELCDGPGPACTERCTVPGCGDGVVEGAEQCDDGNAASTDDCLPTCVKASCGDGSVRAGAEACDDGNGRDDDACLASCTPARCGDGVVWEGVERCDDGNEVTSDACLPGCVPARCGDGVVLGGEEDCDDGNEDLTDACVLCRAARCGDGVVRRGVEQCDDGNASDADGCARCVPARCGDGFVHLGVEACDDGNRVDLDGCTNRCTVPVCGDGVKASTEACDLGRANGDTPAFLVTQPSGTRIGTDALVRRGTVRAFYDYFSASSHTGLEQVGESRVYLYADASTGRLSLVLTHGIDQNTTGLRQPDSEVEMDITGLPSGAGVEVTDDTPGEFSLAGAGQARGRWTFNLNSDGGAVGPLPFPGRWRITITARFLRGITTWGFVKDDGTRIPLTIGQPVTIEAQDTASQCRQNCTVPRCGDGVFDAGEVCDDGNTRDDDRCSADCRRLR